MIIDIHTHTFPDRIAQGAIESLSNEAHILPHTDGTMQGLISSMEEAGGDVSVVMPVATAPEQVVKINNTSIRNNETYGGKIISFGCIHPDFEDYRSELRRIKEAGIKGIKIHPIYQKHDIDDRYFLNIIDCAAENDLIVLTHGGLDIGFPGVVHCSPKMCRNVVDKIGKFKFILAHMGGWRNWDEVPELLADTDVMLDTSFASEEIEPLPDNYWSLKKGQKMSKCSYWDGQDISMLGPKEYERIIKAFGADRIMYGSDSPWTEQKKSIEFIRSLSISDDDKEKILGENARYIMNI